MAYDKIKSENYANVKGVNQKASTYVTGEQEVLDLINLSFQTPGAWDMRPGMTNAAASFAPTGFSSTILGFNSYLSYNGITSSRANFQNFVFSSFGAYTFDPELGTASLAVTGSTFWNGLTPRDTAEVDYTNYGDFMFLSRYNIVGPSLGIAWKYGQAGGKGGGSTFGYFGLPAPGITAGSVSVTLGLVPPGSSGTAIGTYTYYFGLADFYSYPVDFTSPVKKELFYGPMSTLGITVTLAAVRIVDFSSISPGIFTGATAYQPRINVLYRDQIPGYPTDYIGMVGTSSSGSNVQDNFNSQNIPNSNTTTSWGYEGLFPDDFANKGLAPIGSHYLETWNNRLWMAQKTTGRLYYSEIDDPQKILAENYEAFYTENADFTGIKGFDEQLLVFFEKGIYRVTGYDNWDIQQISDEFGAISDKTIVSFREQVWFMDQNQIIQYDGANFTNVGMRVKNYLDLMDIPTAKLKAWSYFNDARNEVWFGIPFGSTNINRILVYDYVVDSWTVFTLPASFGFSSIVGDLNFSGQVGVTLFSDIKPAKTFVGSASGLLNYFDSTFKQDTVGTTATGITCSFTSRNHTELGKSSTAVYRRLYLDTNSHGVTLSFNINFYTGFATASVAHTQSMVMNDNQGRIDFGIPAAALRFQVFCTPGNNDFQLFGYTLESRFQRRTTKGPPP